MTGISVETRELARRMARDTDCTERQASLMIRWLIDEMSEVLSRGQPVRLTNFGQFRVTTERLRGKALEAFPGPYNIVRFRAAPRLKHKVNQ